jgi:hypothetical protein
VIVDFHCHTRESDGALPTEQLLERMRKRGVSIFSITDHDTVRAYDQIEVDFARVVPGIEINTTWEGNDVHVLGYAFPLGETPVARMLAENQRHREMRARRMVENLVAAGIAITFDDVLTEANGAKAIGRPHVARALIRRGHAREVPDAFARYLNRGMPGYEPAQHVTPFAAVQAILASDGIPVLAHPGRLKDESILDALVEQGLLGLEVFYGTHSRSQVARYRERAEHFGLVMTAGSDFHDATWQVRNVGMDVEADDIAGFLRMVDDRLPVN